MIGIKKKKVQTEQGNHVNYPEVQPQEGQAAIVGQIKQRTINGEVTYVFDADVELYQNDNLVLFSKTDAEGLFKIGAIAVGNNYTLHVSHQPSYTTDSFALTSKEIKIIDIIIVNHNR